MKINKRLIYLLFVVILLLSVSATVSLIRFKKGQALYKNSQSEIVKSNNTQLSNYDKTIVIVVWILIVLDTVIIIAFLIIIFNRKKLFSFVSDEPIKEKTNSSKYANRSLGNNNLSKLAQIFYSETKIHTNSDAILNERTEKFNNWYENINIPFIIFNPIYNENSIITDLIFEKTNDSLNTLLEIQKTSVEFIQYSKNQVLGEIDVILAGIQNISQEKSNIINIYNSVSDKHFIIRVVFINKFRFVFLIEDHTKETSKIYSLEQEVNLYKDSFDLSVIPTVIINAHSLVIEYCNQSCVKLALAQSKDQIVGMKAELFLPFLQDNEIISIELLALEIEKLDKTKTIKSKNCSLLKLNGERYNAEVVFFKLENNKKELICVSINDESDIIRVKENYEKSQKWLQTIIDSISSFIIVKDIYGKIIACNNTYTQKFNKDGYSLIGKYIEEIYTNTESLAIRAIDNEIIKFGIERTYEQQLFINDNTQRIFLVTKNPLKDKYGKIYAIVEHGTDITSIKTLENKLYEAQLEAIFANDAKSQFLANMSHEIRTPINAIIGYSELLRKQKHDDKTKDYIDSIYNSGNSLLGLINRILDLSKIEAGKVELYYEFTDIVRVLNSIKDIFQLQANQKGLEFLIDIKKEPDVWFNLDVQKLKQILINLISNAIKFTQNGYIKIVFNYVTHKNKKTDIILRIIDTGIGISKENEEKLFKPFSQIESGVTRTSEGTGLGLIISRQLVELLNGTITLKSVPEKGSEFIIRLENIEIISNKDGELYSDDENIDYAFEKTSILVIDDNNSNRNVVTDILSDYNFELFEGKNGKEGLEMALKHKPNLILLDIRMPDINGFQVATKIRELLPDLKITIIAYTAIESLKYSHDVKLELFDDKLIKPINRNTLLKLLSKYIKNETIGLKNEINKSNCNFNKDSKLLIKKIFKTSEPEQVSTNRELKDILTTIKNSNEYSSDIELATFTDSFWEAIDDFNVVKTDYYIKILKEIYHENL